MTGQTVRAMADVGVFHESGEEAKIEWYARGYFGVGCQGIHRSSEQLNHEFFNFRETGRLQPQ